MKSKYGEYRDVFLTEETGMTIKGNENLNHIPKGVEFFHNSPKGNSIVEIEQMGRNSLLRYKKGRKPEERDFMKNSLTYTSSSGREREVDVMGYSKLEPHLVKVKIKDKERGSGLEFLVRKDNLTSRLKSSKLVA